MKFLLIPAFLLAASPFFAQNATIRLDQNYCQTITAALWALGGSPENCPRFVLDDDDGVATFSREDRRIRVDSATVRRIENRFGDRADDALAAIIGHEIWHAMMGQTMRRFGNWGEEQDFRKDELSADLYGLMLAHFANFTDAPAVFDEIFGVIRVSEKGNYPIVTERKTSNDQLKKQANQLISLFEASNMALVVGTETAVGFAIGGYRQVMGELLAFPELRFDLGLAFFTKAVMKGDLGGYVFPLEIVDADALKVRITGSKSTATATLLDSARVQFEAVLQIDRALEKSGLNRSDARRQTAMFFQARLGLLSIRVLKNEIDQRLLDDLQNLYENATAGERKEKAELLKALALLRSRSPQNERVATGTLLKLAGNAKSPLVRAFAEHNVTVANGEKTAGNAPKILPNCPGATASELALPDMKQSRRLQNGPQFFGQKGAIWAFQNEQKGGDQLIFNQQDDCPCASKEMLQQAGTWQTGQGGYRYLRFENGDFVVKLTQKGGVESCFRVF